MKLSSKTTTKAEEHGKHANDDFFFLVHPGCHMTMNAPKTLLQLNKICASVVIEQSKHSVTQKTDVFFELSLILDKNPKHLKIKYFYKSFNDVMSLCISVYSLMSTN